MPIILILGLLLGGGVSVAAEHSLPGDLLYPVKVSVNESVRGGLTFSSESKASYEVKKVEKRLAEAEELAAEGKLDAEAQAEIEASFDASAQNVASRVNEIKTEDPQAAADISSEFQATLSAHDAILAKLSANADANAGATVAGLATKVKAYAEYAATAKKEAEAAVKVQATTNAQTNTQASSTTNASGNVQATTGTQAAGTNTQGNLDVKVNVGL